VGKKNCVILTKSKDNIKIILEGTGREGVDGIYLTRHKEEWRAVVNEVIKCCL